MAEIVGEHRVVIGLRHMSMERKRSDVVGKALQHLDHDVLLNGMAQLSRRHRASPERPGAEAKVIVRGAGDWTAPTRDIFAIFVAHRSPANCHSCGWRG